MNDRKKILTAVVAALFMLVLIFDTKTALYAGSEGVKLCISTLIPSLFPFFLVSILLTSGLTGLRVTLLGKLLRIPKGTEALVIIGLLGGYPVGAQSVAEACRSGALHKNDAKRLLAFCSNAGPAFLFGIGARLFPEMKYCWLLWAIHILSSWLVAVITPGGSNRPVRVPDAAPISLTKALRKAIEIMALVCGWVVIFRVLLGFAERWILWWFPEQIQIVFGGLLELAGGCCGLLGLGNLGTKFTLCSVFLGFGGLCVLLQTKSVTEGVDASLYLPGKITQAAVSFLLCIPAQLLMAKSERMDVCWPVSAACVVICLGYGFFTRKMQKNSSISALSGV